MGHWSENLVSDVLAKLPSDADPALVQTMLRQAAADIELLSGRAFGSTHTSTLEFDTGGLPFIEVPDLQIGTPASTDASLWAIPDPVHPHTALIAQVAPPLHPPGHAGPAGLAFVAAGHLVAWAHASGRLTREYVIEYLRDAFGPDDRLTYLKRLIDPTVRLTVPVVGVEADGWWLQITRRLILVTRDTPDEQRLIEPLFDIKGEVAAVAATEPMLIVARATEHPVTWAMPARIWPSSPRPSGRPWRLMAKAIHGHGIPILTVDSGATAAQTACQLLLVAYWHGYLTGSEPALPTALGAAYPEVVARIKRATRVPSTEAATALLLNGLLHPGFDPDLGAGSAQRYVNRKATVVIREHLKVEAPGPQPWERLGVSERFYYKLLARHANKPHGRYLVDDVVVQRIEHHLAERRSRAAAEELLLGRGFTLAAARKWLQRHPRSDISADLPKPRHGRPNNNRRAT